MRLGRWVVRLGASASALLLSAPTHAAQSTAAARRYSLDYSAPASCPTADALRQAIEARTTDATAVARQQASVSFTLQLGASGDTSLWVDLTEGSFRREFHADSCAEAIASVAVIAAMVLEAAPAERRALAAFPAPESARAASATDLTESPPPSPSAATAPLPDALPPPLPALVPPASRSIVPALPRRRWGAALIAGTALESAVAPTAPWGLVAGAEAWLARGGWWAPAARLTLLATASATTQVADGSAQFRLLAGRLALCPSRVTWGERARLLPCASFELGSLRGQGGGVARNPKSAAMLWAAPGLSLRGQLALSGAVALEAGAAGKLLLEPATFLFTPSSLVYRVPGLSGELEAGLVVRFL